MSPTPHHERVASVLGKRSRADAHGDRCSENASNSSSPSQTESPGSNGMLNKGGPSLTPFSCTYEGCLKAFATAAHRKRHERSRKYCHGSQGVLTVEGSPLDTGILPYECPLCGKRFARSDVRGRHITGIHDREPGEVLKGIEPRQGAKLAVQPS